MRKRRRCTRFSRPTPARPWTLAILRLSTYLERMRAPLAALAWEIGRGNRKSLWLVLGTILLAWVLKWILPEDIRETQSARELVGVVQGILMALSLVLVFAVFNYTEATPARDWTGFPYRLLLCPFRHWFWCC